MKKNITAHIFRFDPERDEKPYYVSYELEASEPTNLLVLLQRIQNEIDSTLSFRDYCCGLQMCRSCRIKVNNKKRLACITIVKPGEKIVVDPLTFPKNHVKDLVVKDEGGIID